ncbi:MAG: hypothetical protein ABIT96_12215 [Ferruginibacter sp.]
MKKFFFLFFLLGVLVNKNTRAQNVAINNSGNPADVSAILDVQSTNKGLLIPKMNQQQRNLILTPAVGLLVYQTDVVPGYYYYNGSNWIAFSTGSATNYWSLNGTSIYSNVAGNVGIGASAPNNRLQIGTFSSPSISGNDIAIGNGTQAMSFYQSATNSAWYTTNNFALLPGVGGTGNVGVGTGAPTAKLHLAGNMKIDGTNSLEFGAGLTKEVSAGKIGYQIFSPDALDIVGAGATGFVRKIKFWSEGGAFFSGKVGIGLTNPRCMLTILSGTVNSANNTEVLQLAGKNPMQLFSDANGTDVAYMKGVTDNSITPQYPQAGLEIGAAPNTSIYLSANYGPVLTIASNNNVGIGTTNPTYKLSVNGNIRSKEVVVETGWADYVFDPMYKLTPLNEVEKYILQNKHLANIPSAAEIETNGLKLGDTQKKMMEKIEELTLYIIQLNKKIEKLEKRNN